LSIVPKGELVTLGIAITATAGVEAAEADRFKVSADGV
jgi:hypothetical protein